MSHAQLLLGNAQEALQAAREALRAEPSYSKALFREAKAWQPQWGAAFEALLALKEPSDAFCAVRLLVDTWRNGT